jgi:hypothetical protein
MNKLFPANEHTIERVARVALGLGVLSLAFVGSGHAVGLLGRHPPWRRVSSGAARCIRCSGSARVR